MYPAGRFPTRQRQHAPNRSEPAQSNETLPLLRSPSPQEERMCVDWFSQQVNMTGRARRDGSVHFRRQPHCRPLPPRSSIWLDDRDDRRTMLNAIRAARGIDVIAYFGHGVRNGLSSAEVRMRDVPEFARAILAAAAPGCRLSYTHALPQGPAASPSKCPPRWPERSPSTATSGVPSERSFQVRNQLTQDLSACVRCRTISATAQGRRAAECAQRMK